MTPALGLAGSSLTGSRVQAKQTRVAAKFSKPNMALKDGAPNTGQSKEMRVKGWRDSSGRKGKGYGVFRFEDQYGQNVDGYSPIFSPNEWSTTGGEYKLGSKGLIIWFGLLGSGLAFAAFLIFSTSSLAA